MTFYKEFVVSVVAIAVVAIFFIPQSKIRLAPGNFKDVTIEIDGKSVGLKNGDALTPIMVGSTDKISTKYFGNEVTADFNEDGVLDVAFIITQSNGGTGTFYYVVVALGSERGYVGTNAIFIGDRIAPQTTEFRDGQIIVNFADRKPGEAMTIKPSVGVSKYFKVAGEKLLPITKEN